MNVSFIFKNEYKHEYDNIEISYIYLDDWQNEKVIEGVKSYDSWESSNLIDINGIPNPTSPFNTGYFKFTPINEYAFIDTPSCSFGSDLNGDDFKLDNWEFNEEDYSYKGRFFYSSMIINSNPKTVIFKENNVDGLVFDLIPLTPPTQEKLPYVSAFKVGINELEELKEFIYNEEDEEKKNVIKSNILGMFMIPFNFEIEQEESVIFIDKYSTNIMGLPITDTSISKELGAITIPDYTYNQSIGNKNISLDLVTPYFPIIELDVNETMAKELSMNYVVDVLGGKATLNVTNETDNVLVSTTQKTLSLSIPYIIDNATKNDEFSNILYNETDVCYIKALVQVPVNTKRVQNVDRINLNNGYQLIRSENPMFRINGTEQEKNDLLQKIRNGVIL